MHHPIRLPPASCCSCLDSERTSKCMTPSCPPSAWTSQTCWMTVRTVCQENPDFIGILMCLMSFKVKFKLLLKVKLQFLCLFVALRQCSICQAVAEWECVQCYEDLDITPGHLKQYCQTCNTQVIFFLFLYFPFFFFLPNLLSKTY